MEIATEAIDRPYDRRQPQPLHGGGADGQQGRLAHPLCRIAGGADIILIPELPYTIENVCAAIERRAAQGKTFSILAVAEGAMDACEARMKKKERAAKRAEAGYTTATNRIAKQIEEPDRV